MYARKLVDQDFQTIALASGASATISSKFIIQDYAYGMTVVSDAISAFSLTHAMQVWHVEDNTNYLNINSLRAIITQYTASLNGPGWVGGNQNDVSAMLIATGGEITFSPKSSAIGYVTLTLTNYNANALVLNVRSSLFGCPTLVNGDADHNPLSQGSFNWGGQDY